MKNKKPLYLYEIYVHVKDTWVMEVEAENVKQAKERLETNHESLYQTCSLGGWQNKSGKNIYKRMRKLK